MSCVPQAGCKYCCLWSKAIYFIKYHWLFYFAVWIHFAFVFLDLKCKCNFLLSPSKVIVLLSSLQTTDNLLVVCHLYYLFQWQSEFPFSPSSHGVLVSFYLWYFIGDRLLLVAFIFVIVLKLTAGTPAVVGCLHWNGINVSTFYWS